MITGKKKITLTVLSIFLVVAGFSYFYLVFHGPQICSDIEWMRRENINGKIDSVSTFTHNSGRELSIIVIRSGEKTYEIRDVNYFYDVNLLRKDDSVWKEKETLFFTFYRKDTTVLEMDFNNCGFGH